ncbi:hypothetical protein [Paucibacter sp. XJ19-41]|uniref:hypothetical protein n=1 Tax=Paucibacter sp. XJ19-41 TaxID=2927824 RepID=UPI00234BFCD6|nr:hypothetical protein [Paucibacter sp. XJ19-41]MDC6166982.1 hypothetical protein [Paucibacter sp. XJ19-41]
MNTSHSAKTLVLFTVTVLAMLAVIGAALLGSGGQPPATEIVKLERVVIVGKRSVETPVQIAQLPRVVITGRSTPAATEPQLASAGLLKAKAL